MKKVKSKKIPYLYLVIVFLFILFIYSSTTNQSLICDNLIRTKIKPKNVPLASSSNHNKSLFYVNDSIIWSNSYAIRIESGNIIIENSLNLTENKLNGTSVINSTIIENSLAFGSRLTSINLYNNVTLNMSNIFDIELDIILYDNAQLTLRNCSLNIVMACGSSRAWIINSSINYVGDYHLSSVFIEPVSSEIYIFQESNINEVTLRMGVNLTVDNSSITNMFIGFGNWAKEIVPLKTTSVKIFNSTINFLEMGDYSRMEVFESQIGSAFVYGLARLILNASFITTLDYGIICYTNSTNVINRVPIGSNFINNTQLIGSIPGASNIISIAVNGSASVYVEGWPASEFLYIYSFDSSLAVLNNTIVNPFIPMSTIFSYNNSQLILENSTYYGDIYMYSNSSLIVQKNCNIEYMTLYSDGPALIDNSTIFDFMYLPYIYQYPISGSPKGNIVFKNSTISSADIFGSTVVTFIDCNINFLQDGIVIYDGLVNLNSTGISGSGSYTNYTKIITSTVSSRQLSYIEVNNTATINFYDDWSSSPIINLMQNANAIINNVTFLAIYMINNTNAIIHNSTGNIIGLGNSNYIIDQNSTFRQIYSTESCSGTMIDSIVTRSIDIYHSGTFILQSSIVIDGSGLGDGIINIYGSNPSDYSIKIYNSSVDRLKAITWGSYQFPIINQPRKTEPHTLPTPLILMLETEDIFEFLLTPIGLGIISCITAGSIISIILIGKKSPRKEREPFHT
ncbi:MAG: hypothetical protein ACFFDN_10045 [Candidatus Hodarchaeota archaeon]